MSAVQLWKIAPGVIPTPEPGSVFLFVDEGGAICCKTSSGEVARVVGAAGEKGAQGDAGPKGAPGVAGASGSKKIAVSPLLAPWTTAQNVCLGFDTSGLFTGGGALSFFVQGANNHLTTAANLVISLRIGGVAVLTQTFALGTTARTARAWRVEGRVIFDGVSHVASMRAAVDFVAAQADVGTGTMVTDASGSYVEVVTSLSAAVAGANLSLLGGYAVKDF